MATKESLYAELANVLQSIPAGARSDCDRAVDLIRTIIEREIYDALHPEADAPAAPDSATPGG